MRRKTKIGYLTLEVKTGQTRLKICNTDGWILLEITIV